MNHATWSLGASTTNWRHGGPHPVTRPPRPGSTSPHRDRKGHLSKKTHDDDSHHRPRSGECTSGQYSPVTECHDKRHSYHYLGVNAPKIGSHTPPAPRHQKTKSQKRERLSVSENSISKSPSAPNLHPTATSMLALQGSLTAFTVMAAHPDKSKSVSKAQAPTTQGHCSVVITSSPEEDTVHSHLTEEKIVRRKVDVQLQSQPQCSCRSTMSPIPRLDMHAHVPDRDTDPSSSAQAWQERRPNTDKVEKHGLIQHNKHLKNYVFKETSV